jgi:hypothetical protein
LAQTIRSSGLKPATIVAVLDLITAK